MFTHILSREECIYNEELDRYVVDLDILTSGGGPEATRDLADIIFISDTYMRVHGRHVRNVIPVTTFTGTKKDLTMVALGRYLRANFTNGSYSSKRGGTAVQALSMIVKDVRDKIQSDFKTTDYL